MRMPAKVPSLAIKPAPKWVHEIMQTLAESCLELGHPIQCSDADLCSNIELDVLRTGHNELHGCALASLYVVAHPGPKALTRTRLGAQVVGNNEHADSAWAGLPCVRIEHKVHKRNT